MNLWWVNYLLNNIEKYMNSLVDNLNIPYGKSAVDKLFSLQS